MATEPPGAKGQDTPQPEAGTKRAEGDPDAEEPGGGDRPRVEPVALPSGLADAPAGPWLCEALDGVDPEMISGFDTVEVMCAAHRQANRQRAIFLRTLLETGLRAPDTADEVVRVSTPSEFAAEEARAALVWSRRRADTAVGLAFDVFDKLPALGEAMLGGWLDEPRAKAFVEWTTGLTGEQATLICADLLPEASGLMVGDLIIRIQRAVYALDPDWAQRRYEDKLADRRIIASRNEDGTANVEGQNLPADRAAAACDRIDALARAVKHAGAGNRRIDQIRVDLFLGSTDGTFEGLTDDEIISHVLNHPLVTNPTPNYGTTGTGSSSEGDVDAEDTNTRFTDNDTTDRDEDDRDEDDRDEDDRDDGDRDDGDGDGPDGDGAGPAAGGGSGVPDHEDPAAHRAGKADPDAGQEPASRDGSGDNHDDTDDGDGTDDRDDERTGTPDANTASSRDSANADDAARVADAAGSAGAQAGQPARRGWAVRELRVEMATLLGWNQHPGEIPGTGYLPAKLARHLAGSMGSGQWRYAICSTLGQLITCGILASRPCPYGATTHRDVRRGGIVEIQVTTGQLNLLGATAGTLGQWTGVMTELAGRYAQHLADTGLDNTPGIGHGTSAPGASLDRAFGAAAASGTGSADARRRLPGARLRRDVQMRDRQCVHPACRMPATRTDQDHAHDHAHGGLTTAANLAAVCRWHHRLKHDGGWTVIRPEPAINIWGTPLGHTYHSVPPPVMPRLPNPQRRNNDGYDLLPNQATRECGCYGHCTCGPTMPTDTTATKNQTEDQPALQSEEPPLNIDDEPPY